MEHQENVTERMELLETKFAELRNSNRIVKVACVVLAVACLAFGAIPQASSSPALKSVAAQQFVLVDNSGNVLATLGRNNLGPLLTMTDAQGRNLLRIGIWSQSAQTGTQISTKGLGLQAFDGNGVLPGNGAARAAIGVSDVGIGTAYLDTTGTKILSGNGVTPNDSSWGPVVYDANGSARGGVIYDTLDNFVGLFVNDSGANRGFVALALDGSFNAMGLKDSTGINEAVVSESSGTGAVTTFTNGTESGHLP